MPAAGSGDGGASGLGAVRGSVAGLGSGQFAIPEVVVRVNGEDVELYGPRTTRVYQVAGIPAGTRVVTVTTSGGTFTSKPVVVRPDETRIGPTITVS